jgi:hypothetical protein
VVWLTFNFKIQTSDHPGEKHYNGNHGLAVPEVAEDDGISVGSCHTILLEDLGMCWVSEKCSPRLLTDNQKLQ